VLSAFPPDELERVFDRHVDALRTDFAAGKAAALRAVAEVRGRPAEARAVVKIGAVIGRADGIFDDTERAVVREAIDVLGLDPADFAVQAAAE
jgi:tellurite resistance protein TerB